MASLALGACAAPPKHARGKAQPAPIAPDEAPAPSPASWQTPSVPDIAAGIHPYLDDVRERRAGFNARGYADYVYVLTLQRMAMFVNESAMRIEVREGKVHSVRSLLWGGAPPGPVPTMDELFAQAEYIATLGLGHKPARFSAEYDAHHGYVRVVDAKARADISDTESYFEVACFSLSAAGCAPILLEKEQCVEAGGSTLAIGADWASGWSLGLIGDAAQRVNEVCVRRYKGMAADELTPAQCQAVGGREGVCGLDEVVVGSSQQRETTCCRLFVR